MNIFDSYIEAGQQLSQRDKEQFYTALIEFIAYGREPNLKGAALAVFIAIRPSLEISMTRANSGRKGGLQASKTQANGEAKRDFATEQNASKPEANRQANGEANGQANSNSNSNKKDLAKAKSKKAEQNASEPEANEAVARIVAYLNERTGSNFRPTTKSTVGHIKARLSEGYTESDFIAVIDGRVAAWRHDAKMAQYLRPETLFAPSKFEGYLQAARGVMANGVAEKYRAFEQKRR